MVVLRILDNKVEAEATVYQISYNIGGATGTTRCRH